MAGYRGILSLDGSANRVLGSLSDAVEMLGPASLDGGKTGKGGAGSPSASRRLVQKKRKRTHILCLILDTSILFD